MGIRVVTCVSLLAFACTGEIGDANGRDPALEPNPEDPTVPLPDAELEPVEPLLRRLTRDEYAYTLEDVLGVRLAADDMAELPVDRPLAGFVNVASGQSVEPDHVRAYHRLAARVADDPAAMAWMDDQVECAELAASCRDALVDALGRALFRRPLDARETDLFAALFDSVVAEEETFERARRAVLQAMLQSPPFLYLVMQERDGDETRTVGGYEMASRLSYLAWASAPDDALYAAAEDGTLDTPEGVRNQLQRLLEDERSERVRSRFLLDWAGLESIPDDDGLKAELTEAAVAYYLAQTEGDRPLAEIFDTPRAHLTPALAEAWGLDSAGDGVRDYDLSDLEGRAGLLAQPGVVAGMTNADGGAIVARGLFLQRQLFCGEPPDPPASLQEEIDAFVAELPEDASDRSIAETRLMRGECGSCHAAFDPLAYAFEHFDHRGAYRSEDEHGNSLRDDGWIPESYGDAEVPYAGFDEYVALIAEHPRVQRCFVQRHLEYALGARLERAQLPGVVDVAEEARTWDAMLSALVAHDLFRVMHVPEAE